MDFEINLLFLIEPFFLHDQKLMTKMWISWERKELLKGNKKHFSSFLKGFHLSKIISDLRVRFKNFAILETLSNNKVAGLLLTPFNVGCFWNLAAANTFLQLNVVFIADSRTSFCSGTSLKIRVEPQKLPLKLFCKKSVLRKFANFARKYLRWSLFLAELQTFRVVTLRKRDSSTILSCGI